MFLFAVCVCVCAVYQEVIYFPAFDSWSMFAVCGFGKTNNLGGMDMSLLIVTAAFSPVASPCLKDKVWFGSVFIHSVPKDTSNPEGFNLWLMLFINQPN